MSPFCEQRIKGFVILSFVIVSVSFGEIIRRYSEIFVPLHCQRKKTKIAA